MDPLVFVTERMTAARRLSQADRALARAVLVDHIRQKWERDGEASDNLQILGDSIGDEETARQLEAMLKLPAQMSGFFRAQMLDTVDLIRHRPNVF